MKKFLATILCFVYVVASSGATINLHYCMGKFIGWDVNTPAPVTCDNCGMHKEQKKGCCNDKHEILQVQKDQLTSTANGIPANIFVYVQPQYFASVQTSVLQNTDVVNFSHGPPLILQTSSHIFNCVFRI